MIRDLNTADCNLDLAADIVVIGGGTAGLVLAERLSKRRRVLVLESGPFRPGAVSSDLDIVEQTGSPYRAPTDGRSRGLGGTSNKWGGALLPFQRHEFESRANRPEWPVSYESIAPYYRDVEQLFGLNSGPYDQPVEGWSASNDSISPFLARYAKWPPFSRRNVAALLHRSLRSSQSLDVVLNATCSEFQFDDGAPGLRSVTAYSPGGRRVRASASQFVLAAGAIESTRLLQWALRQPNAPRLRPECPIGTNLHDHISTRVAEIKVKHPASLNRLVGFRFDGDTMRSFRLEPSMPGRLGMDSGGFAHIAMQPLQPSGFDALRDFFRGLQARQFDFGALGRAAADAPYLMHAAYWRYANNRLLWPSPARFELHLVVEQAPESTNRIALSSNKDQFGIPRARVHWNITDQDVLTFGKMATCLDDFWRKCILGKIGTLAWDSAPSRITRSSIDGASDVFHPGGTTRMGRNDLSSVVNSDLRVWGLPNLSVLSTSTFPSAASANPTMTLLAFAFRLCDKLQSRAVQ